MKVQCPQCGEVQPFDEGDPICFKCGHGISDRDITILKNPRKGRGMMGVAFLLFLCFLFVFVFFSKFYGGYGMALSFLVYLWGIYKVQLNKKFGVVNDVDQTQP